MARTLNKPFSTSTTGNVGLTVILLVIIFASIVLVGGTPVPKDKQPRGQVAVIATIPAGEKGQSLQINKLLLVTVTPSPSPTPPDPTPPDPTPPNPTPTINRELCNPNDPPECCHPLNICKPVIYLYPLTKTMVDVRVETVGKIIVSDPLYPKGGWRSVTAHPDGTLQYQGKNYSNLFFETDVLEVKQPETSIIIPHDEIEDSLHRITTQFGLVRKEQSEFLEYWVPRLKRLNSPYILFSLITGTEKEKIDNIFINPSPDTFIEFLAYFKPLSQRIPIKPLSIPKNPPIRIGFTAVEWGGTIRY